MRETRAFSNHSLFPENVELHRAPGFKKKIFFLFKQHGLLTKLFLIQLFWTLRVSTPIPPLTSLTFSPPLFPISHALPSLPPCQAQNNLFYTVYYNRMVSGIIKKNVH